MNIPKSYEALAADLASEKIISKTLLGQKEAYMMLADKGRLDLATWKQKACEAAEREAALREELDSRPGVSIKNCIFEGKNADGSQAFEFETLGGLKKLTKINLDGWLCYGPSGGNPIDALQQRLTVAEQREAELEGLLREVANLDPRGGFLGWQLDGKIESALKPAAKPHKCIECDSQYCHGVCVERGDDDERYKGAEGEGS